MIDFLTLSDPPQCKKDCSPILRKKTNQHNCCYEWSWNSICIHKKQRVKTIVFKLPVNLKTNISINSGAITYKPPPISDSILYLDINLVPKDWNTVPASKWIFHAVWQLKFQGPLNFWKFIKRKSIYDLCQVLDPNCL